ncbi:MGMT family protein [Hahella sp. NBU794]|uniref:MGMT family protein n=1 Tax=Hahella sp. NBU794 TaxID=3422590 RepID=UPI003D6F76E8
MSELSQQEKLQAIWFVVSQIPPGKVATYGQVASLAGLPGLSRYVGYAMKQLPDGSSIPWHRVINSQGKISFPPTTKSFFRQQSALTQEGVEVHNGRIPLKRFQWPP